ncbi:thioredoxin family protein [Siminovitchia sp. FSL H7-0308]|uniref:thioredoxin family protein n=1 Tax=unclassified Siminovitchia TaxID=2837530 RepID=UPI00097D5DAB|nr:thioredoxin family protein [Bacillus sp. VT-16-64]
MDLHNWYEKGLTPDEYIETLEYHKDGFSRVYDQFTPPEDERFFQSIKDKQLRVIVLAEPWCGHCMLNIPVLLRLAEKTDMPVRFLLRDQNLELMDRYLTNEKRIIPIFIFIDENGNEVAKWGPITDFTKKFVDGFKKDLPPKDDPGYDEKFKVMVKQVAKSFRENPDFWNNSYESMKTALYNYKP